MRLALHQRKARSVALIAQLRLARRGRAKGCFASCQVMNPICHQTVIAGRNKKSLLRNP